MAAAASENFTSAATTVAMTQSGVSQQVAKLEQQLGVPLFKRVNKSVLLTDAGRKMVRYIESYLDQMSLFVQDVLESDRKLEGLVSYAMPNSCLLSPHLAQILKRKKLEPNIKLKIEIMPNLTVYEKVLTGEVDFGFVTVMTHNPALEFIPFCDEEFVLVGPASLKDRPVTMDFIKIQNFISFPGMKDYFDVWLKKVWPRSRGIGVDHLNVVAEISQLHGVITLLEAGIGLTLLPRHCIDPLNRQIVVLNKGIAAHEVVNKICIIRLADARSTTRSQAVIDWFLDLSETGH
jgi:LysR family transcriptional regulator, transcriptional activator of the cysJI operon